MKNLSLCLASALICSGMAIAQTSTPSGTGSGTGAGTGASSGTSMGAGENSGSMGSQSGSMGSDSSMSDKNHSMKGDKKMKGCIQSSGGQYMLQEKNGKTVNLSGSQDLSAHVGHMVAVHGSYGAGSSDMSSSDKSSSDKSKTSSGGAMGSGSASAGQTFNVSSVDMISESCTGGKMGKSGSMSDNK